MEKIVILAPAKINLFLNVGDRREDGYHDIETVMQTLTLFDRLEVCKNDCKAEAVIDVRCRDFMAPDGAGNIVYRAASAFFAAAGIESYNVSFLIEKKIPAEAGLGGGSSDAAAAIIALDRLYGTAMTTEALCGIGAGVGADVPFCVRGGLQRAQGVGERLTPLAMKKPLYLVAFQPCRGLSTKEVFTALHEDGIRGEDRPDNEAAQRALAAGDVRALGAALGNVLEPVSRRMRPEIDRAIRAIEESGAVGARMTGSGSAVFGVFMHAGACRRAADRLAAAYPTCRMMRTAAHGVVVEEEA